MERVDREDEIELSLREGQCFRNASNQAPSLERVGRVPEHLAGGINTQNSAAYVSETRKPVAGAAADFEQVTAAGSDLSDCRLDLGVVVIRVTSAIGGGCYLNTFTTSD